MSRSRFRGFDIDRSCGRRDFQSAGLAAVTTVVAIHGPPYQKQVGPIKLGDLRSGRTRALHGTELGKLLEAAGL
jgi:hypothetical protein